MEVVVLGAGFSGLIAAQYFKSNGYQVLLIEKSDRVGGEFAKVDNYTKGLKYLHSNDKFDSFLKQYCDLDYYIIDGAFYDSARTYNFPEDLNYLKAEYLDSLINSYCMKTRKVDISQVNEDERASIMNSTLKRYFTGNTSKDIAITNTENIINQLSLNLDVFTNCTSLVVDPYQKTVAFSVGLELMRKGQMHIATYDILVSTIPLPTLLGRLPGRFLGVFDLSTFDSTHKVKFEALYNVYVYLEAKEPFKMSFDYFYFPRECIFHRISFSNLKDSKNIEGVGDNRYLVVEMSFTKEEYAKWEDSNLILEVVKQLKSTSLFSDCEFVKSSLELNKIGHFVYDSANDVNKELLIEMLAKNNIFLLGRYGAWDHNQKIDSSIDELEKIDGVINGAQFERNKT